MNSKTSQKAALVLGVASAAVSIGNVAVKAGPALQTLNNLTNTAEFSINNTYGQSFSVDGMILGNVAPFTAGSVAGLVNFTASTATLTTGFQGSSFGNGYKPVTAIKASVSVPSVATLPIRLDQAALGAISLQASGTTQTVGASISSTLFGPSSLKATTSFTNQLINDLSAF